MKTKKLYLLKLTAVIVSVLIISIIVACKKDANQNSAPVSTSDFQPYSLGCELLPTSEYAKIPQAKAPEISIKASVLNLNVPPIGNQGSEGCCVAFGTTYDARSINWQSSHSAAWSNSVNIFSPEYVYNQIKISSSCGSGSYVVNALNLLESQGVCTWSTMPYVDGNCSVTPTAAQKTAAGAYKISGYSTCAINETTIKSFLASGKPVIVAGNVNNAFENLKSGAVLTTFKGSSLGGHCYCVVGYDDTKSAFKFMNSWGTSWATAGFGYIAYANIAAWWSEAYVIN
jgi:C1A family cysteine protease